MEKNDFKEKNEKKNFAQYKNRQLILKRVKKAHYYINLNKIYCIVNLHKSKVKFFKNNIKVQKLME